MYKMKEEILREKLQNLSSEQLEWINTYCENDMSKLKKISYNAFFRYGIPQYEHDELYDDDPPYGAVIVRTSTPKIDDEKNF